ncbi:NADAR family protein [Streptomyces sp. NBC_01186]|uniref:NADAR family protein n=1 Tax=Streptomyces sp. NBC_01186 TaxID=2903765 RepID=UPI002E15CB90|nr:NADAR family protein [Streptomyces sp. NBC_01186]
MTWRGAAYRVVDGERIDGAWCHVWRRHPFTGDYVFDDLLVYADGTVECAAEGEPGDLEGLRRMLESGRISVTGPREVTEPKEVTGPGEAGDSGGGAVGGGARPSGWASRAPRPLTPEGFFAEAADKVEELSGRPTLRERCAEAVRRFGADPCARNRELLREAYLAVPPHLRVYALGDMDQQDRPLRILFTAVGEPVEGDGPVVTEEAHQRAVDYFRSAAEGFARAREQHSVRQADDPEGAGRPVLTSHETVYPQGWPERPGLFVLRNEYPVTLTCGDETFDSVLHGYWSLAAADPAERARIRHAATGREARELGTRTALRADWPALRLAVMTRLLRAKFTQHPELARVLLSTGDARISYTGFADSRFWLDDPAGKGRNWTGRLLELVRSELADSGPAGSGPACS